MRCSVDLAGCSEVGGVRWSTVEYSGVECKVKNREEGSERRCCRVLSAECRLAERGTRFVFVHF